MRRLLVALTALALALGLLPRARHVARAQLHRATDPVATPASSTVLLDDALALDVNPAALGMLPSWSAAFLHSEVDRAGGWLGRGDALYFATPVFGPLALGTTLQSIRPESRAARPLGGGDGDRAMAALSLALAPGPGFSLGLTTRTFYSGDPRFDGLTGVDVGMLARPSSVLGFSLVGRDLFVSREGFGTTGLELGSSVLFSVGVRPFGDETLTLDLGLAAPTEDLERLSGRGGVAVSVPYLGTASGVLEVVELDDSDPALRVVAELAIHAGNASVAVGGMDGDGFEGGGVDWYAMARFEGRQRRGVPPSARVLDLRVGALSARSMIGTALALERARTDSRVGGVLLRMRGSGAGFAYAQELRLQIRSLQKAGKPVVCHLTSASGAEYYACAGADRILMDPAGDVRLMGTAATVLLFGETLDKVGVRADFIRIGAEKSAPEQFAHSRMSEEYRRRALHILDSAHGRVVADLADDLNVPHDHVAALMDAGPYLARGAVESGLVTSAIGEAELKDVDLEVFEGQRRSTSLPPDDELVWGQTPGVGVVVVDDTIVDGESTQVPLLDIHTSGGETIVAELDSMARDPNIRVIVLRVDSPGGAVMASDRIWRAVRRARERKPVIASMGAVAASGGYYVASAADEIWADPSTLTGSIGIFYGKVDVARLADMLGVHVQHFSRGKHAGAQSMFRPFTAEERAALADTLRAYYRTFLARVAEGRDMTLEQVDALGRGQVFLGDEAQRNGLVDRLGGFASALIRARQLAQLPRDARVVVRPERKGLLQLMLGGSAAVGAADELLGTREQGDPELPTDLRQLLRMVVALEQLGRGRGLALMPAVIEL
ncbi:MAG: signal peptide peptidase SppA [Myxococcales bacterium]